MRKSQKSAVVAGTVIALVGGGAAFAYWTSTGAGDGSATTGTDTKYTVTVEKDLNNLYPGGPSATVDFSIKNTGEGVQKVQGATASIENADGTAWSKGSCTAADFTVSATSDVVGQLAKGASVDGTFTIALKNLDSNQDDCKNATVPLHVVVN